MVAPGAQPATGEVVELVKDMGVSHAECWRLLPGVCTQPAMRRTGDMAEWLWPGRRLCITLGPERERVIASLRLAHTLLTLRFEGFAADERVRLLAAFDRRFQRGGG
jgi:hypothetical protein